MAAAKKETTKKRLQGVVLSKKNTNTIAVEVEVKFVHPIYNKIMKKHKKFQVHCTDDSVLEGDKVVIEEGKPVSKNKSFYFVKKLS